MKTIKIRLRYKLFICGATLLAGYFYWYTSDSIFKLAAILVFFILAEVMVWQCVSFLSRSIGTTLKITFASRKAISWIEIPEFSELANQMRVKLHKKRPFGIKRGFNNAYANHLTGQIVFGEDLLQKLGKQERLALAAHELTHLKQYHWLKISQLLLSAGLIVSLSLSLATGPAIVSNLISAAALMITFVFANWRSEFAADRGAALHTGKAATISLLQSIVPANHWQRESETHPSISNRISRLERISPPSRPQSEPLVLRS